MIYTSLTKQALRLCFDAHREQTDKTGLPYVFHPFHLAEQMDNEETVVAALLHDVVEDSETTFEDLCEMGFDKKIVEALKLLTHDPKVEYMDYVKALKNNPIARAVKLADLRHNSDMSRLDPESIDEYAIKRAEKYKKAIKFLEDKTE